MDGQKTISLEFTADASGKHSGKGKRRPYRNKTIVGGDCGAEENKLDGRLFTRVDKKILDKFRETTKVNGHAQGAIVTAAINAYLEKYDPFAE